MKLLRVVAVVVVLMSMGLSSVWAGEGRNGGFADTSANEILKITSRNIAIRIKNFSDDRILKTILKDQFGEVPEGYSKETLANIIENVRAEGKILRERGGRELMFDYGTDANGPYITALRPFFLAYLAWNTDMVPNDALISLAHKLVHEAAHHFKVNGVSMDDTKAKKFAQLILSAVFQGDIIECDNRKNPDDQRYTSITLEKIPVYGLFEKDINAQPAQLAYVNAPLIVTIRTSHGQYNDAEIFELSNEYKTTPTTLSFMGNSSIVQKSRLTTIANFEFYSYESRPKGSYSAIGPKPEVRLPDAQLTIQLANDYRSGTATIVSKALNKTELFNCQQVAIKMLAKPR